MADISELIIIFRQIFKAKWIHKGVERYTGRFSYVTN